MSVCRWSMVLDRYLGEGSLLREDVVWLGHSEGVCEWSGGLKLTKNATEIGYISSMLSVVTEAVPLRCKDRSH
jgi:hypothetical protein